MEILRGKDIELFHKQTVDMDCVKSRKSFESDAYYIIYKIDNYFYAYATTFKELECVYKSIFESDIITLMDKIYDLSEKIYVESLNKFSSIMESEVLVGGYSEKH